jgi:hypothetical protein
MLWIDAKVPWIEENTYESMFPIARVPIETNGKTE